MKRLCVSLIRWYQKISGALTAQQLPLLVISGCRSWPTCSEYSIAAIEQHGVIQGTAKSIVRILRCNPFISTH